VKALMNSIKTVKNGVLEDDDFLAGYFDCKLTFLGWVLEKQTNLWVIGNMQLLPMELKRDTSQSDP
jgi:hypothetical protein